jgi:hypothetical protein
VSAILNIGSRGFNQAAIFHARRTSRFAAAAGEAKVDVFFVSLSDRRAVCDLHHLVNAAAGRIHLDS